MYVIRTLVEAGAAPADGAGGYGRVGVDQTA